jgi:ankyrin repeat protein
LSFGINLNPNTENEDTPLSIAVKKNKPDIVLRLLCGGADPNQPGRVLDPISYLPLSLWEDPDELLSLFSGVRQIS